MMKAPAQAAPAWPSRASFVPQKARDHSIFIKPIAGERLVELTIRDPYGCSGERNRECLIDFVEMLARASAGISEALVISFDGESVEARYPESSALQRTDLETRWRSRFNGGPNLRHIQLSRRQIRHFHDRSVKAKTASGREIIWDISNGLDGVMLPQKECTVHVTIE
jgi:hypothetical protein